MSMTTVHWTL